MPLEVRAYYHTGFETTITVLRADEIRLLMPDNDPHYSGEHHLPPYYLFRVARRADPDSPLEAPLTEVQVALAQALRSYTNKEYRTIAPAVIPTGPWVGGFISIFDGFNMTVIVADEYVAAVTKVLDQPA